MLTNLRKWILPVTMAILSQSVLLTASPLASSPLQFIDSGKSDTTFSWDQVKMGTAFIYILNPSDDQNVTISTTDFTQATRGGTLGEIIVVAASQKLPKLTITRFVLKMKTGQNANPPSGGSYSGSILIQDATQHFAPLIRQVTVRVSGPQPAVPKLTMMAWRFLPFAPIWRAKADVPLKRSDFLPNGTGEVPIGFVQKDTGGIASVLWTGTDADSTNGSSVARIRIDALPHTGKYDGDVSLNPNSTEDNRTGVLSLSVIAKDVVVWPILVMIAGIYIAFATKRYLGVLRIVWMLRKREAALGQEFRDAQERFAAATQRTSYSGYSLAADVAQQREQIRHLLDAIESAKWVTDLSSNSDYKAAVSSLQTLQSEVDAWGQLGAELSSLAGTLSSLVSNVVDELVVLPSNFPSEPVVVTQAREVLTGQVLKGADLDSLRKKVANAISACRAWNDANQRTKNATAELFKLQQRSDLNDAQKKILTAVKDQLVSVWKHLWEAPDVDSIGAISANGGALDSAEISLAGIDCVGRESVLASAFSSHLAYLVMPHQATSLSAFTALSDTMYLPANDDRRFDVLTRAIRYGDRGSAILAFVIALLTGLNANYLGKPFGTLQDYITVFLWGAGTKATLDVITAVLDKFAVSFSKGAAPS